MKMHANTMMVKVAMCLLFSMRMTSHCGAERANLLRQRKTRREVDAASPVVAVAAATVHTQRDQTAREWGRVETVEEEENLEVDHYFHRTVQSSMALMADTVSDIGYAKVTIKNDTPHDTQYTSVNYEVCQSDFIPEGIVSGYLWTGPDRGFCLVTHIYATLTRPEDKGRELTCTYCTSSYGTAYSEYFIILVDGRCCVRSSHQSLTDCNA